MMEKLESQVRKWIAEQEKLESESRENKKTLDTLEHMAKQIAYRNVLQFILEEKTKP